MSSSYKSICQEIKEYFRLKQEEPERSLADPRGSFEKSLECGCEWCSVACKALETSENVRSGNNTIVSDAINKEERPDVDPKTYYDGTWETRKDKLDVEFRKSGTNFKRDESNSEVFVLEGEEDPFMPIAASISGYTGSEESFQTAFAWLEECVKKHHTLCPLITVPPGPGKLPTRIVDVSTPIRLVETKDMKGYYACLSHCWGKEQPLTTTNKPDTLSRHKQEIKWDALPKTFQEAIQVTRRFGIQYLWIDSLCIIQDNQGDWEIESAQMADIYQNSVITFAGSASSGHKQGLFRNANPRHIDCELSESTASTGLQNIRKRKPLPHDAVNLPLMHRGWVFQERLLSPRYLHFGQDELIWECMERQTCECGGLHLQELTSFSWLAPKNRLYPNSLNLMKSFPWSIAKAWHAAVKDYSHTDLTRGKDVFPAISGIVKNVQKVTGWTYIAGLWKEHLIIDLAWKVENPKFSERFMGWRAPSFSWASVISTKKAGSSITYDTVRPLWEGLNESNTRERTDIYAEVIETYGKAKGIDPTGQITYAHVKLSGTLIEASIRKSPVKRGWDIAPKGDPEPLSMAFFYDDYNFESEDCCIKDGDSVFCLKLIGSSKVPNRHGEYLLYLVLKEVRFELEDSEDISVEREFERIGLLRDAKGEDDERLEDRSEESAIQRDVVVKIV